MKRVGLIGCGAIGTLLSQAIEQKLVACDELVVYDFDQAKAETLKNSLKFPVLVVSSVDEMLAHKPVIVVEAASHQAVRDYAKRVLASDIDLIVLSTGALLELDLASNRLHLPAGAIGGLDAISSAKLAGIEEVVLTSRKNPKAFGRSNGQAETIYEGTAEEAAKRFPREMNVAATLALTVKTAKVKVHVISDPQVQRNTHEIRVKWRFGDMLLRFENEPHPKNPHTSALAAWSAIKLLQNLVDEYSE